MNKQLIAKLALVAMAAGAFAAAQAATVSANFTVTMKITSACAITTAPGTIDLGTAVASTTAVTNSASTTFKVNCSNKTPFTVGLLPSAANSGTANGTGNMLGTANGDKVPYTLYSNSALTTVWGNTPGTNTVAGTGGGMAAGKAVSFTAYAQAVNADFAPDTYNDTVTVNVNY
ncbi:MAG: hypothetical protein OJF60_000484 [Burkholderiaceae bacterium]|jgi:spore coat protein U-like protein|nr:MAG: hypothetical protein OJF60_000484 [Burkholderiaceae bacterium]